MSQLLLILFVAGLTGTVVWLFLRGRAVSAPQRVRTELLAERVRSVGKLVGLEVCAKEIATATKGWAALPPLLLSQARLAMIFHFEKQYSVDLSAVTRNDVVRIGPGRFRVRLPGVRGDLRLIDMTPYDIQDGRVLGLLDVIQMNASTQKDLMDQAQEQAAGLFDTNGDRYMDEARRSIERQISSLTSMLGVEVEIAWADSKAAKSTPAPEPSVMREAAVA